MAAVAWIIGAVAGYVDAGGFVLLQGVLTSHATGYTAHLGARGCGRGRSSGHHRQADGTAALQVTGVLWVVFLAGTVFGAYAQHLWGRAAEMNLCCAGHYRF